MMTTKLEYTCFGTKIPDREMLILVDTLDQLPEVMVFDPADGGILQVPETGDAWNIADLPLDEMYWVEINRAIDDEA